ncbi:glycosyltransferase [Aeromicrobium sp.]|nr:glycosyltransferase [Candidatus Saccharibacteria bacterium]
MTLTLNLFVLLSLLELLLLTKAFWPVRRPLAAGLAIGIALLSGTIVGTRFSLATILIALLTLYRVLNLLRIVQNRSEAHYLRKAVRRTSLILFGMQIILLIVLRVADATQPFAQTWWLVVSLIQLAVAAMLFVSTQRHLRTTIPLAVSEHFSNSQLPSLSVCIPARNETVDLEECLESLLASDYPKLEIIVLDDCSQSKHTSDIIRSFAHEGVRFINGKTAPGCWLSKNWAYEQLFEASSGTLVLFCGVDIRFEPTAVRSLLTAQIAKDKRMMSVIPRNAVPRFGKDQLSLLIQPARYAWEFALPRRLFNRPPVLSSCWVAERTLIDRNGSFAAVKNSISPEAYFAKRATRRDGYSFVQSTSSMAITTVKTQTQQWATAVRTRYPQLRRRPENVCLITFIELGLILGALPMLIVAMVQGLVGQAFIATLALTLICLTYAEIVSLTYRQSFVRALFIAPLAVILDVYIRHESLWRYEFGEVSWKGRNVCLPVMRTIPRLPRV